MIMTCGACRFWENQFCKRYPPTKYFSNGWATPSTDELDWCGEFSPTEEAEQKELDLLDLTTGRR